MYLWIINFWPFLLWTKKKNFYKESWPSYTRLHLSCFLNIPPYQLCHSRSDSKLLHDTLGFSPSNNSSFLPMTGRLLPRCSNVGQLIIYQSTLLFRTWQLLSAQDSCTLPVWSKMSVSANATRLTSLMMSPHFEQATQSLIKNSDSFSPACRFALPFPPRPRSSF